VKKEEYDNTNCDQYFNSVSGQTPETYFKEFCQGKKHCSIDLRDSTIMGGNTMVTDNADLNEHKCNAETAQFFI